MTLPTKVNTEIAKSLIRNQHAIAEIFANALQNSPRWQYSLEKAKENWNTFLKDEFYSYVYYLSKYFATGDSTYKYLYFGEKLKSLYDASLNQTDRNILTNSIYQAEKVALENLLKPELKDIFKLLSNELLAINSMLTIEAKHKKRIVFVGDCLFLDVIPFVIGSLVNDDISIQVEYITSKNPIQIREDIKYLRDQKIDLIFFSPFTYEFSPDLSGILDWRGFFKSEKKIAADLISAWSETQKTVDHISDLFDCPTYVHNASFVLREENVIKRFLKCCLTSRVRHFAQTWINTAIKQHIMQINQKSFGHVFMFDELRFVHEIGEFSAGELIYNTKLQHPSVIGKIFAKQYVDIIYAQLILTKMKIVVCDLDNTLWNGVIGEGKVTHYHERQQILKSLKNKGVVLAINSKNDPKNVHWENATLNENDFVASSINWMPKVQGMAKIQKDLNLKMNSFVFIDDRSDELELMRIAHPEILSLNAQDFKTWTRFEIWLNSLEDDMEMDRTLMYKQREQRKVMFTENVSDEEEKVELFSSLGLKLTIMRSELSDLKRVTELVNRTNQFNLEGTRVSLKEMINWYGNTDYIILIGRTSDRFGDMGITCVSIGKFNNTDFILNIFVLSCRVFGYQFEHAVMNHIKSYVASKGAKNIYANYVSTPQNSPCKNFLYECGFIKTSERFTFDLSNNMLVNAPWLTVEYV